MKIHHLNCGTMRPWCTPTGLVCHVLLIETGTGLALVDTGLGGPRGRPTPGKRFGPARHFARPAFDDTETALWQVRRLGFDPADVTDIVLTHFDADHAGGLADFPWARIHLTSAEVTAALHPDTWSEKRRYKPALRAHGPTLVRHTPGRGEAWYGFPAATELTGIASGVVLIGLHGHTRGHAAVAVDADDHWVLHTGDAFYHHGQIDGTGTAPKALLMMERALAHNWNRVQDNHERLAELWQAGDRNLMLVNAHDPHLLSAAQARTGTS